jgi:hypothetical protein
VSKAVIFLSEWVVDALMTDESRTAPFDVPSVSGDEAVTVTAGRQTFSGEITRVDEYGETTAVERVISYTITFKHQITGEQWEPWKAYLIEEPVGEYRLNVIESDGSVSRTDNMDAPTEVAVESAKEAVEA